ncbi:hypothetical protein [Vibrio sp. D431a]|uniref:hypothetical protein n=1 Tax=Vibrio sp. D431a TaxID=2837388 RepID=UPI00255388F7|nr:hypothetical protein [Vibrio sp. D431a]MDK9789775.1 hypothetical protein [Vibrio sp. D431a]
MAQYKELAIEIARKASVLSVAPKENPEHPTSTEHLFWMLRTIIFDNNLSETKAARWLGYVHAVVNKTFNQGTIHNFLMRIKGGELKPHAPCREVALDYLVRAKQEKGSFEILESTSDDPDIYVMLRNILNEQHSEVSANFLLGYAQGALTLSGEIDVNTERERTRSIFNGA